MNNTTKPPLGITPERIHAELRLEALQQAMGRYSEARMDIPPEWMEESDRLTAKLAGISEAVRNETLMEELEYVWVAIMFSPMTDEERPLLAKRISAISEALSRARSVTEGETPEKFLGVVSPSEFTFEAVNEFVHQPGVQFEHLQGAMLSLAAIYERTLSSRIPSGELGELLKEAQRLEELMIRKIKGAEEMKKKNLIWYTGKVAGLKTALGFMQRMKRTALARLGEKGDLGLNAPNKPQSDA